MSLGQTYIERLRLTAGERAAAEVRHVSTTGIPGF
jgi:hypothetical protein